MEHEILLDVRHLTHIFPLSRKTAVKAVDDVSFQIRRGEIFGLVGESGSGKSTLLRCATGLETPDDGEINYDGTFGLVFQNFNLFPHLFGYEEYHRCTASCDKKRKKEEV